MRPRRLVGVVLAALVALGAGVGLSACGSSGAAALGHTACVDVARSITEYEKAGHEQGARASALRAKALGELRNALQPAALASASDTAWQALTATLSETSRVAESALVSALQAQCAATLAKS